MRKTKGFGLLAVILIIIATAVVTSIATGVIMLNNSSNIIINDTNLNNDTDLKEFVKVYETLLSKYYDNNLDKKGMLNAAEEAMVNFLGDKYTTYLDDKQYKEILDELSSTYNGIGILVNGNEIIDITPSSPAEKAGIKSGDVILMINGKEVENLSTDEIKDIIQNDKKEVQLVVSRNTEVLEFNLVKEDLQNKTVSYEMLENTKIGYIYIKNFSENLKDQVDNALKDLEENGMRALIIDVRNNVGGYLASAEKVASIFLEEGKTIYSLETSTNRFTYKDETKERRTYKIVVLINGSSASASEVLAAALKESYGASLVGTKTYGKGKVQQVIALASGNSVKYTSAKWLTPAGICIDGIGIDPDFRVELTNGNRYDSQIEKAIEVMQ